MIFECVVFSVLRWGDKYFIVMIGSNFLKKFCVMFLIILVFVFGWLVLFEWVFEIYLEWKIYESDL